MFDPNDNNVIEPADAMAAHLAPGVIIEPAREEPAPPAPDTPTTETDPGATETSKITEELRATNDRLAALLEQRDTPVPKEDEPEPHPSAHLLEHEDPEVRELAQRQIDLDRRLDQIEQQGQEAKLEQQEQYLTSNFRITQAEINAIYARWQPLAKSNPDWRGLTLIEAAQRIVGYDALAARRIVTNRPATPPPNGKPPAVVRQPARVLTEPAVGGAPAQAPRPKLDHTYSTEEAVNAGWDAVMGSRR